MPAWCLVLHCGSNGATSAHLSFFRIPKTRGANRKLCEASKERREIWIKSLKRKDLTETKMKNGRICSLHFQSGKPAALYDKDNIDWIPNKQMGYKRPASPIDEQELLKQKPKSSPRKQEPKVSPIKQEPKASPIKQEHKTSPIKQELKSNHPKMIIRAMPIKR